MLLAFGASFVGPRPADSAAGPERSPVVFHQYMVNLAEVPARRNHFGRFAFTNRGNRSIEIRRLNTSCGCLTEHMEKREFAAGETGEFTLRIQAANQTPGNKEYTCEVVYGPVGDDSVSWSTDLVFRMVLPEQSVTLNPRALIVHQFNAEPTRNVVSIFDTRARPLKATAIECDRSFVTVSLLSRNELKPEDIEYGVAQQVEIVVGATPPGQHDFVVRVATDDPEFDVIRIPVRVYGPVETQGQPESSESGDVASEIPPFVD
jgi:hypothetical protein